jgi:hypothetical protein
MWEGAGKIRFGIYACSPEDSSFKAVFTDLETTECVWKAHDVQQPDMGTVLLYLSPCSHKG